MVREMKSNFVLISILAVIAVVFCGCEKKDVQQEKMARELASVKAELVTMQEQVTALQAALATARQEIAAIKTELAEGQAGQKKIQNESQLSYNRLSHDVEKLRAELKSASQVRDQLQEKVRTLTVEKKEAEARVNTESQTTYGLRQQVKELEAKLEPLQNAQLAKKLQDAESYVQSGNWQAAEQLMVEIRSVNPNYPGLDALNSRINIVRSQPTTPNGSSGQTSPSGHP
jgi:septal ring factor EnvC (AmiA/AmiB activator)